MLLGLVSSERERAASGQLLYREPTTMITLLFINVIMTSTYYY